jgi:hypothetical protein
MDAEWLRDYFTGRGWSIHMDKRDTQPLDPFVELAEFLSIWTPEQHRRDAKVVRDEMQRLAEARTSGSVFVPIEDASNLLLSLHRAGLERPAAAPGEFADSPIVPPKDSRAGRGPSPQGQGKPTMRLPIRDATRVRIDWSDVVVDEGDEAP